MQQRIINTKCSTEDAIVLLRDTGLYSEQALQDIGFALARIGAKTVSFPVEEKC